ncbi:HD domain-containing protein [Feifania hominis]|uniref:HD domain-containing protein n=1 Tax=Feifania hominis TaxID=2763660 RepID=A0A926HT59_9FIRM|nr:HD domain-containing protein [Feifania hominis]MBC8535534.1 HD domain-containing protein [Feifania hominis]
MIYTPLTNKAMRIAYAAHQGQTDKSGQPYIFHPYHLAEQMTDEVTICVALLHDVAEDTDVTLQELAQEFPKEIVEALRLLTHTVDMDYFDYVRAICKNPVAKAVKLADLAHNADESRFSGCKDVEEAQFILRREKYSKVRAILEGSDTD